MAKDTLDRITALLKKRFGGTSALRLGSGKEQTAGAVKEVLPTGINVVDRYLLGIGGLPIGRMCELYSQEAAGKTSFSYQCIASAQSENARCFVLDAELSFDEERAQALGADPSGIVVMQPEHLEMGFEQLKTVLIACANDPTVPTYVCFDTLSACRPKILMDAAAGEAKIAAVSWLCSQEFPKIIPLLGKARAALLVLNQIRNAPGVMFGDNTVTAGGNAIKFYASWRGQFLGGKAIKGGASGEEHVGKELTLIATKTRFTPPFRKARLRFRYDTGWHDEWCTLEHAKTQGLVAGSARGAAAHAVALSTLGWSDAPVPVQTPDSASQSDDPFEDADGGDET